MHVLNAFEIIVALLYGLGTFLYFIGVFVRHARLKKIAMFVTLLGFAVHSYVLVSRLSGFSIADLTQGQFYISLLAWTVLLIYLLAGHTLKLDFLGLTASPLALTLFLWSMTVTTERLPIPPSMSRLWFGLHIGSLFLSIALMGLAFGAGLVYLHLERRIKSKEKLAAWTEEMPSLASFDRVNHLAVAIGFPLNTLGILAGFLWAKLTWHRLFSWDPKEIISIVIWLLFAYLFHQRMVVGWRGRKPAKLAVLVFLVTLGSLLVINFFFSTHHSFQS